MLRYVFFRTPCSKPGRGFSTGLEHACMGTALLNGEMEGSRTDVVGPNCKGLTKHDDTSLHIAPWTGGMMLEAHCASRQRKKNSNHITYKQVMMK
jgi:hypothetical protein